MALAARDAVPVCLLLLVFLPSWDTQTRPQGEPDPDVHTSIVQKNNLKEIIKLLDHRIQVLHQKNLMHERELSEKQDRSVTVHMNVVKGSSVKVKATPSSLTTQEIPFSNSYSILIGNKLHKISPNIFMDTPERHNKVKGAGTEEDKKKITLLPGLKQDKIAGNNGGRSVRTTNITIRFHSADNSSKTQIDIYNLKDPREVPEVHIVASNIINQGIKSDSVVLKDNGLQVIVNSSVDKNVKHILEKGRRKALIISDHGKSTAEGSERNPSLTALTPLKANHMEEATSQPLVFEDSKRKATSALKDESSKSIVKQQTKTSVEELENILNDLKMEREKQESLPPSEKMQSSVMEDILQELKEHPEEADYRDDENRNMLMESFPKESQPVEVSDEPPMNELEASPVPYLRTEVTNEDMKDAKRFEFFEKYEDIQGKKRAKAADLKELLKHIIIACVAVTGLILAVIVLVHIYTSLFVKKQEPDKTNADVCKKDEPDKNEVMPAEKKGSQQSEDTINNEETGSQQLEDNTADIGNQNNNNVSSPPPIFPSTDCDKVPKPLDIQPIKTRWSPNSPSGETDLLLPAEPLGHSPDNCFPSYNSGTCKNLKIQSRTFKTNCNSCNSPENYSKPKDHDYKRCQTKDIAHYRTKSIYQRLSEHRPKSTEPKRWHKNGSSKQQSYSSSSWVGDPSSNFSIGLDTNENIKESGLSQHDGSECACFQHIKGSSSTDSYSD
ncbi:uncharacterized protein LOC133384859 isoform X2 [Rhineura floridana]|uniref:uncharacterized protein LOC133384859 isoform X2 n=1 Tax=Rhineura floridana TaxID=261503 RepID=UPI002AC83D65|nr:uncharacterized protein LOC133384859 isoform X2 [Rhineura floridana]